MTYEEKLLKRIEAAQAECNWAKAAKLIAEHSALLQGNSERVRYTLREKAATEADRKKLTEHVIAILILADLCYKHALEFGDHLARHYDLHNLDLIEGVTHASEELRRLVCTVDVMGDERLSNHYAEMVEEIELRGELPLLNTIRTVMQKRINYL